MTRIIVTGSRNFTDSHSIYVALKDAVWMLGVPAPEITIVHGGARGADALAGMIGHHMMMRVEVHPADWQTHHNAAGSICNREMVALGADLCIGFPFKNSRGTWYCLHAAARAGIPTMWWDGCRLTTAQIDEPGNSKAVALYDRRIVEK